MKRGSLIFAICMIFAAGTAMAEKVPTTNSDGYVPQGDCPTDGYKSFTGTGGDIPDATAGGITYAPINVPDDGETFTDVIVDLDITHTWTGDLRITVSYDAECDGQAEASANVVCRPGRDCDPAGSGFGCSGDLAGTYRFSDDGAALLGDPDCPAALPAGCYAAFDALSAFDGMAKGGCFTVTAEDNAAGDTGSIGAITIWADNSGGGTPTEAVSWGDVKARF